VSERRFRCAAEVAPIRAEPHDGAEQVTQALAGEPLAVEETRSGWARVRTAYDYPGWVREDVLEAGEADRSWLPQPSARNVLDEARIFLGSPYLWGGMTERGIDCSGLVHMAYRRLGRLVPRDADQQEAAGTPLAESDLCPGDLVTYGEAERATHIAFWLGSGRILHSTERDGVNGVIEEAEPADLQAKRRRLVRL
jgi:cell wall-associated NlpC family hydrolase